MSKSRRNFLKKLLAASAWCLTITGNLLTPVMARAAWPAENFKRTDLKTSLSILLGKQKLTDSDKIKIKIPEIAENGNSTNIITGVYISSSTGASSSVFPTSYSNGVVHEIDKVLKIEELDIN